MEIQNVDFVGIPSQDAERSRRFYGEVLGLRRDEHSESEFWAGDTCIATYEPERLGFPFGPMQNGSIAFRVDDVAAARAELEARGVTFDGDVFESKVCHMTTFHDPDGNELMLHRRFAPYSDGTMP
jgi:catechol 2,3-dioxygenase-like lactoylglutathione lyase family enzyme